MTANSNVLEESAFIKKELKSWEHEFYQKHGKHPSKEDVKQVPEIGKELN
jgi:hypothetical protein